ncbi:hypothetical protein DACRYDRAFT_36058, partial [Dacryopinax primogenitus]
DQHNKRWRYGLYLHAVLDTFSGCILWVQVWWMNSNPQLIFHYYLDMACKHQGIPLITQSDLGSENNAIANGHTLLHQWLDPGLVGVLQHQWMRGHANIKPEILWSKLQHFPKFVHNIAIVMDISSLTFHHLAIPLTQMNLNEWIYVHNTFRSRKDRKRVLPQGRLVHILNNPNCFMGACNFKVGVATSDLHFVEDLYAPKDHPVFELVPSWFEEEFNGHYLVLGSPPLTKASFWIMYHSLLHLFLTSPHQDEI